MVQEQGLHSCLPVDTCITFKVAVCTAASIEGAAATDWVTRLPKIVNGLQP